MEKVNFKLANILLKIKDLIIINIVITYLPRN
jgi:hypothetical protein